MTFLDTNILVYAVDAQEARKHSIACTIVENALASLEYRISTQVLFEFSNVSLRKLKLTAVQTLAFLEDFSRLHCIVQTPDLVFRAVDIKAAYDISLADAMILAAAERAQCDELLTEDLNDGQRYAGVVARNPFK